MTSILSPGIRRTASAAIVSAQTSQKLLNVATHIGTFGVRALESTASLSSPIHHVQNIPRIGIPSPNLSRLEVQHDPPRHLSHEFMHHPRHSGQQYQTHCNTSPEIVAEPSNSNNQSAHAPNRLQQSHSISHQRWRANCATKHGETRSTVERINERSKALHFRKVLEIEGFEVSRKWALG